MGDNSTIDLTSAPVPCMACAEVGDVVHRLCTGKSVVHFVHNRPRCAHTGLSTAVEVLADGAHLTLESHILAHELGDFLDGVQCGGVVTATERSADHRER
jgi:hypothetical protein